MPCASRNQPPTIQKMTSKTKSMSLAKLDAAGTPRSSIKDMWASPPSAQDHEGERGDDPQGGPHHRHHEDARDGLVRRSLDTHSLTSYGAACAAVWGERVLM